MPFFTKSRKPFFFFSFCRAFQRSPGPYRTSCMHWKVNGVQQAQGRPRVRGTWAGVGGAVHPRNQVYHTTTHPAPSMRGAGRMGGAMLPCITSTSHLSLGHVGHVWDKADECGALGHRWALNPRNHVYPNSTIHTWLACPARVCWGCRVALHHFYLPPVIGPRGQRWGRG